MSRNNKNARRIAAAREISKTRQAGGSGPSSTTAKHGKKNAWWQKGDYAAFVKGRNKGSLKDAQGTDEAVLV